MNGLFYLGGDVSMIIDILQDMMVRVKRLEADNKRLNKRMYELEKQEAKNGNQE